MANIDHPEDGKGLDAQLLRDLKAILLAYGGILGTKDRIDPNAIAGFLEVSPELLEKSEEAPEVVLDQLPHLFTNAKEMSKELNALARVISEAFGKVYPDGFYRDPVPTIACARVYFLLLVLTIGEEEATLRFERALRRNFIRRMMQEMANGSCKPVPEFVLSLDEEDQEFFDGKMAELEEEGANGIPSGTELRMEALLNGLTEETQQALIEIHPDMELAFARRMVETGKRRVIEEMSAKLARRGEEWERVHTFLRDPERIQELSEEIIGGFGSD
ncbi:MAG: hypothetical protein WC777_01120 [Candidatus Gracilibacteria bacterium]|jgi:hypothetical protein